MAEGASRGPRPVTVTVTPDRRGVLESVALEIGSSAPFGLLWWAREVRIPLTRPLHVAPRLGMPGPAGSRPDDSAGSSPWRVPSGAGEPRGVRPFEAGDSRRSVHWPATSHVGVLMVRERERQNEEPVVVEVVLSQDPAEAEAEAERVMGLVSRCSGPRPAGGARDPRGGGSLRAPGPGPGRPRETPGPRHLPHRGHRGSGPAAMTLWERVVQANRPGPPEHSVPFRVASAGTVVIAIAACRSQGELSDAVAVFGIVATIVGNALSYRRRERPWPAVKPVLAVCAIGGFVWFIVHGQPQRHPG